MELFIRTACLLVILAAVSCEECVDSRCFTANSTHAWNGVTINYGCQHTGSRLYRCSMSIMGQSDINNDKTHCVALGNIPGIHQFCESHVLGLRAPPSPPFIPDVNKDNNNNIINNNDINEDGTATDHPDEKPIKYETEYITCIEVEVLVGVSIGSFVLGSFVTWALITILAQCKNLKKELRDTPRSNSIRAIGRPLANCDMTSTSAHKRLLSIGSAESCPNANPIGQHNGQSRRYSGETGHEESGSGRPSQMRQPLPAPPAPIAKLQHYYVQPIDSLYACASDKDYQSIQGGSEHYAPVNEASNAHGDNSASRDQKTFYAQPIDSLYTCASDKDYQSLQGGSEHYAPVNEGSDYTSLKSNRNTVLSEAKGTAKSNGENGGRNDYCSLESARNVPDDGTVYYPASDGSNRDYTDLIGDGDSESYCSVNHSNVTSTFDKRNGNHRADTSITDKRGQTGNANAIEFRVNGWVGYSDAKQLDNSSKPVFGQCDSAPQEARFGLCEHVSRSEMSEVTSRKKRVETSKTANGNGTVQHPTTKGISHSGLIEETSISTPSGTGNGTMHGRSLGTKNSYAGTDLHDYESCNGSIHEYFILEDATSAV